MRRAFRSLVLGLVAAATLAFGASAQAPRDPENMLFLDLEYGRVTIVLRPDLAPRHVARVKELVRQKFYDGLLFHRVIEGFMAQTGDPRGNEAPNPSGSRPRQFPLRP